MTDHTATHAHTQSGPWPMASCTLCQTLLQSGSSRDRPSRRYRRAQARRSNHRCQTLPRGPNRAHNSRPHKDLGMQPRRQVPRRMRCSAGAGIASIRENSIGRQQTR